MKYLASLALLLTACAPRALQSELDALRFRIQQDDMDHNWRELRAHTALENRIKRLEPVYRADTVYAPPLCLDVWSSDRRCYRIDSVRVGP